MVHSRRNRKVNYLMSGRLTCARCGHTMAGNGKRNGEKSYTYYLCLGTKNDSARNCDVRKYVKGAQIDALVWEWAMALITDPEALQRGLKAYLAEETEQTEGSTPSKSG